WLIRPFASACCSGPVTCSCPTTSANVAGRYLRYSASATGTTLGHGTDSPGPRPRTGRRKPRPLAHPPEPAYPCCLPALGGFTGCAPHEGLRQSSLPAPPPCRRHLYPHPRTQEDSPSGLGRTLGKRVGGNPSRVRISHPPPR